MRKKIYFKEYVRNLDLWRNQDISKFYKILNSLLKYKHKGKLVKGIKQEDGSVVYGSLKNQIVKEYFSKIFNWDTKPAQIRNNGIFEYRIELDKAFERIARNKAVGYDNIPGEIFQLNENMGVLKQRLKSHFTNYLIAGDVPEYFMNARLVLFSKDDSETPPVNKTRPISILPTITKILETSIMYNLEKVTKGPMFWKWQRGFIKGKSTLDNIKDVIQCAKEQQKLRQNREIKTATIVFFDFEKAYNNVPRDILIEKLQNMNIPCNITKLINRMLEKFKLNYNGEKILTNKGLVQGSVLSPILFNLFINDLIMEFEISGIMVRAYADDIAWVCNSVSQTRTAIEIMSKWAKQNKMTVNSNKSGIIRILLRKGGVKQISNWLKIPEVRCYKYLGVTINQSLKLDEHYIVIRNIEAQLKRRIGLLKPSLMNTKSRRMVFKTILRSKISYAWAVICRDNEKYTRQWESMLYRLLKLLFCIKSNVNKQLLFTVLNIENGRKYIEKCYQTKNKLENLMRKKDESLVDYLSIKTIKLKLNWLFQRKPTKPKCKCKTIIDSNHVVNWCPKTESWRIIFNEKAKDQVKLTIWEALQSSFNGSTNYKNIANLLNTATEKLVELYIFNCDNS